MNLVCLAVDAIVDGSFLVPTWGPCLDVLYVIFHKNVACIHFIFRSSVMMSFKVWDCVPHTSDVMSGVRTQFFFVPRVHPRQVGSAEV